MTDVAWISITLCAAWNECWNLSYCWQWAGYTCNQEVTVSYPLQRLYMNKSICLGTCLTAFHIHICFPLCVYISLYIQYLSARDYSPLRLTHCVCCEHSISSATRNGWRNIILTERVKLKATDSPVNFNSGGDSNISEDIRHFGINFGLMCIKWWTRHLEHFHLMTWYIENGLLTKNLKYITLYCQELLNEMIPLTFSL